MSAVPIAVVTGAGGFLDTELIKQLLEKGYTVRGSVRSLSNADKVQHLIKLGSALPGKLELTEADLLQVNKHLKGTVNFHFKLLPLV